MAGGAGMNTEFNVQDTEFEGLKVITPFYMVDNRGYFLKSVEKDIYLKLLENIYHMNYQMRTIVLYGFRLVLHMDFVCYQMKALLCHINVLVSI